MRLLLEHYNVEHSETSKSCGIFMTLWARVYILNLTYGQKGLTTRSYKAV